MFQVSCQKYYWPENFNVPGANGKSNKSSLLLSSLPMS